MHGDKSCFSHFGRSIYPVNLVSLSLKRRGAINYYLGLDFGTSGARACVINDVGAIMWEQHYAYPRPANQTPEDWRVALHTLLSALPDNLAAELQGMAIDGTSGTVLLCDAALAPISEALLYHDQRAKQQAEELKHIAPVGHIVRTASSGLAKFLWLTRQQDTDGAAYFLHQADWLSALLSDKAGISDYHNALKSGYDVAQLCWPDWVMNLPNSHLLPDVLMPGEIIGKIKEDIAAHFGINPLCEVHAGTTDSTAAFIASGVNQAGVGVTSLGTTLVLKQLSTHRIEAPEYGVYSHRYGDLWLVGGASNAGAGVLRQYFDDAQLVELSSHIDPTKNCLHDYYPLTKVGERFPVNDAHLAPVLAPRPAEDVEFLHGLLQGLARIEAAGYAKLAELGAPPIEQVITNGGGAKNEVWKVLRESLLGVEVNSAKQSEAAYGSALMCTGIIARFAETVRTP